MNKISFIFLCILILLSLFMCKSLNNDESNTSKKEENSITINTSQGDQTITIYNQNSCVLLQEETAKELINVVEESLEYNPNLKNLSLSLEDIEKFKKNGISIVIEYGSERELPVGLQEVNLNITKLRVLIDNKHHYIQFVTKGSIEVMDLKNDSYDMIMKYFE